MSWIQVILIVGLVIMGFLAWLVLRNKLFGRLFFILQFVFEQILRWTAEIETLHGRQIELMGQWESLVTERETLECEDDL